MVKATLVDKNGFRKGAWSKEEDDKLRVYIQKYGHWNWRQLPKFAGLSRCGKSCRLRWMNYLRPDVKRGNFSHEEDNLIIQMHEELGNKWSIIAGKLPGRTDNEIKNHWHTNLSKKVKQNQSVSSGLVDKEQSRETSQSEDSQTEKYETESVFVNAPSEPHHQPEILENFPSTKEISCSEFTSMNNDSVSSSVKGAADGLSPMEIFQDSGSDFWNQPFLADNNDNQEGFSPTEIFQDSGSDFWNQPFLADNNDNQEGFSPSEIFQDSGSDFWNQPFLADNNDNQEGFSPTEIFQDSGSDFWNQPFLADNNDNQDGYHSLLFTEEVYMHSYAFNYDDDSIDWIHQMLQ